MIYKGYVASIKVDEEAGLLHGEIANIHDVVTFEAQTVEGLQQAFADSVEDYLDFCRSRGEEPEAPQPLEVQIRLSPKLHHNLMVLSGLNHQALPEYLASKLDQVAEQELSRFSYVQ